MKLFRKQKISHKSADSLFIFLLAVLLGTSLDMYAQAEETSDQVPLSQDVDGIWISTLVDVLSRPFFIMNAKDGRFTLNRQSYYVQTMSNQNATRFSVAQDVKDLDENSVYLYFGSESMHSTSPEIQEMLLTTKNLVSDYTYGSLMNKASGGNIGQQLGAKFASGLITTGLDAFIDNLTTPSKKIYVTEMNIHMANPDELYAECNIRYVYIKGNNQPRVEDRNYVFKFLRWTPETKVYFCDCSDNSTKDFIQPLWPGNSRFYTDSEMRKMKADPKWDFRNDYLLLYETRAVGSYNSLMLKKLVYQVEQNAVNQGFQLPPNEKDFEKVGALGATFMTEEEKAQWFAKQKKKECDGVVIKSVVTDMPAYIFKLKEGDIITHLDGYKMSTPAEAIEFIQSMTPYSNLKINYLHKGKPKETTVVLTFVYKQFDN